MAAVTLLSFLCFLVYVTAINFQGDQVLRIHSRTKNDVLVIQSIIEDPALHLDVWKEFKNPHPIVDVYVENTDVDLVKSVLKNNNIKFEVFIDDLSSLIQHGYTKTYSHSNKFSYNKYNQYPAILEELSYLEKTYPKNVRRIYIGKSFEKRSMIGVKISDNLLQKKPIIWIDGGIHANEWLSPATVMFFINELARRKSPEVKEALKKYEFHILPVFNVDGYQFTFTSPKNRLWRRTRSNGTFCRGIDPNRNWDWGFGGPGSNTKVCSNNYAGTKPFSEIEVRNVADYLLQRKNRLKSYWAVHTYGQMVMTPWGVTKTLPNNFKEMERIAQIYARKVREHRGTQYRIGTIEHFFSITAGGSLDWIYGKLGTKYTFGLELRDTGKFGFLVPEKYIVHSGIETTQALLAAINAMK